MPLPSQAPRAGTSNVPRFSGGRRRRVRRRRFGGAIVILLAIILAWWLWPDGGGKTPLEPRQAGAESQPAALSPARNQPPETLDTPSLRDEPGSALAARNEQRLADAARAASTTTTPTTSPEPDPIDASPVEAVTEQPSPTPQPQPARTDTPARTPAPSPASDALARAETALDHNRPADARDILNRALHDPATPPARRDRIRARLNELAEIVTFSPRVFPGDVTADTYVVQPGDVLSTIPRREGFHIDYRLIQRLNRLSNANMLRVGQKLKILYGPFHARIDKSDFRMDLYADQTDTAGNRILIASFPVGLGEYGMTPVGKWRVPPSSAQEKLINPAWTNPRTHQSYKRDDPDNPIGEHWIPLEGIDESTRAESGYGIHGTIEPDSIGREMSMGCIRMRPDDVALVYELLVPERSTVEIVD